MTCNILIHWVNLLLCKLRNRRLYLDRSDAGDLPSSTSMTDISNFFLNHGPTLTAIIASIALVQPWILFAWNKFFRSGRIDIYETGNIEIGYNSFGPTIGLAGTLKSSHPDFFIPRIQLILVKGRDHSQHIFEWCLFRSLKMTVGKEEEIALELPCGFMVMQSQPHRYNILFSDQPRLDEMRRIITSGKEAWYRYRSDTTHILEDVRTAYNSFNTSASHVTAYTALDRLIYWNPGNYRLCMIVETEPGKSFRKNWSFTLSDEDERSLRFNPIVLLQTACDQDNLRYTFAYPRYEKISE